VVAAYALALNCTSKDRMEVNKFYLTVPLFSLTFVAFLFLICNLKIVDVSLSIIISIPKASLRCTLYTSTLFLA